VGIGSAADTTYQLYTLAAHAVNGNIANLNNARAGSNSTVKIDNWSVAGHLDAEKQCAAVGD
jgi:hypothetical protein